MKKKAKAGTAGTAGKAGKAASKKATRRTTPADASKKAKGKRRGDIATRWKKGETPKGAIPFQKGNKLGVGHGRPPNIGSPRAQLKRFAEEVAPAKVRKAIKKAIPELDVDALSWAEVTAIRHWMLAAGGNLGAIIQTYKQIDDDGAVEIGGSVQLSQAGEDLLAKLSSVAKRLGDGGDV